MDKAEANAPREPNSRIDEEMAGSRRLMMRREQRMTLEQRVELFACLSRDAALIRSSAKRIR